MCDKSGKLNADNPIIPSRIPEKNNFSASEIAILTENVEENLHVSQSKLTNSVANYKRRGIKEQDTVNRQFGRW